MSVFTKAALSASLCAVFFSSLANAAPSVKSPIVTKGKLKLKLVSRGAMTATPQRMALMG